MAKNPIATSGQLVQMLVRPQDGKPRADQFQTGSADPPRGPALIARSASTPVPRDPTPPAVPGKRGSSRGIPLVARIQPSRGLRFVSCELERPAIRQTGPRKCEGRRRVLLQLFRAKPFSGTPSNDRFLDSPTFRVGNASPAHGIVSQRGATDRLTIARADTCWRPDLALHKKWIFLWLRLCFVR